MQLRIQATQRAKQLDPLRDHIERPPPLDLPEAHHHGMKGIKTPADGLLEPCHHP